MTNDRFYEQRHFSKKKRDKNFKKNTFLNSYRKKYSLDNFLSDVGNQEIQNFFESGLVQAKLNVSQPGDIYEQEADRIANNIVNTSTSKSAKIIHKKAKSGAKNKSVSSNSESKIKGIKGIGNPLNKSIREYFEPRFGVDLGNVRIHTDNNANQLANYIQARAFTYGNDIVFGKGEYQPDTVSGKKLIAHELTHTIQQDGGFNDVVQRRELVYDEVNDISYYTSTTPEDWAEDVINIMKAEVEKYNNIEFNYIFSIVKLGWTKIKQLNLQYNDLLLTLNKIKEKSVNEDHPYYDWLIFQCDYCDFLDDEFKKRVKVCDLRIDNPYFDENKNSNVDEEFLRIKNLLSQVDKSTIDMFNQMTKGTWAKIMEYLGRVSIGSLLFGLTNGILAENIYSKYFEANKEDELNQLLQNVSSSTGKSLTVDDLFKLIALFQYKTVRYAELLISYSIKIATEERERYKYNDNDLTELHTLLTDKYAQFYNDADMKRAEALFKAIENGDISDTAFGFLSGNSYFVIRNAVGGRLNKEETAIELAKCPTEVVEKFIYESICINKFTIEGGYLQDINLESFANTRIAERYSEIDAARKIEEEDIDFNMNTDLSEFPILLSVHINFRDIAREYINDKEGFKTRINEELTDSIESGYDTLESIYRNPDKVWEFAPLIKLSMANESITEDDNAGSIIWDHYKDIDLDNTIRSFAMAGAGIILGVLGFFTGGSTWAALALGVTGAAFSVADLIIEMDNFKLHSDAVKAVMGYQISEDPGVLGIAFAIAGLVLDIVDIGVAAAKIAKAADAINTTAKTYKNADNFIQEVTESARRQYDELFGAGSDLKPALSKDEWVDSIVDSAKKHIDADGNLIPNVKYRTGEFNYLYETDDMCRIKHCETDNLQLTAREKRLPHDPNTIGKEVGDHAGHLFADRFGGSPEIDNLVSQLSNVNLSKYKRIENTWANALKEVPPKKVTVSIDIKYVGNNMRPSEFVVKWTIDGEYFDQIIPNF